MYLIVHKVWFGGVYGAVVSDIVSPTVTQNWYISFLLGLMLQTMKQFVTLASSGTSLLSIKIRF